MAAAHPQTNLPRPLNQSSNTQTVAFLKPAASIKPQIQQNHNRNCSTHSHRRKHQTRARPKLTPPLIHLMPASHSLARSSASRCNTFSVRAQSTTQTTTHGREVPKSAAAFDPLRTHRSSSLQAAQARPNHRLVPSCRDHHQATPTSRFARAICPFSHARVAPLRRRISSAIMTSQQPTRRRPSSLLLSERWKEGGTTKKKEDEIGENKKK
jgi:hypothetical protein